MIAKVAAKEKKAGSLLSRETFIELGVLKLTMDAEEEVVKQLRKGEWWLNEIHSAHPPSPPPPPPTPNLVFLENTFFEGGLNH